ncbi:hypothetical protein [Maribacter sp.]|uniref:hypothetical protein n=1 Tax=Maribacter sp. TaxID=1897614 RepID=UPI0025C67CA6|nr:hypothetical protein [Maribacter sp.]
MSSSLKGINFLVNLFNFDVEGNIPTLYSTLLLLFCALLLSFIAKKEQNDIKMRRAWYGLSIIFLFLAIDEATTIHERLMMVTRNTLNTSGLLFYSWVIPYGFALIIFLLAYIKFLIQLPKQTAKLFIFSGFVFVTGAVLIEMIEGWFSYNYGANYKFHHFLYTIEELLEMFGLIGFIYALLNYRNFTLKIN